MRKVTGMNVLTIKEMYTFLCKDKADMPYEPTEFTAGFCLERLLNTVYHLMMSPKGYVHNGVLCCKTRKTQEGVDKTVSPAIQ